jgi:hypothetical protein
MNTRIENGSKQAEEWTDKGQNVPKPRQKCLPRSGSIVASDKVASACDLVVLNIIPLTSSSLRVVLGFYAGCSQDKLFLWQGAAAAGSPNRTAAQYKTKVTTIAGKTITIMIGLAKPITSQCVE